jgi:hypothetical protein
MALYGQQTVPPSVGDIIADVVATKPRFYEGETDKTVSQTLHQIWHHI